MDSQNNTPRIAVIGYGSLLREDDGVGRLAAERLLDFLGSAGSDSAGGGAVDVHPCHQLTPEMAEALAAVDRVLFIDAAEPEALEEPDGRDGLKAGGATETGKVGKAGKTEEVASTAEAGEVAEAGKAEAAVGAGGAGGAARPRETSGPRGPDAPSRRRPPGTISVRPLVATALDPESLSHHLDPGGLLALARALYGRAPEAVLLTVTGERFGFGDRLSPVVEAALPVVIERIRVILDNWKDEAPSCTNTP